ncbi:MAG: 50S ribosomal protein L30 [Calditrichaeota bacterium]|nr:50S ribosomal protein L30 [Calditrichota bacterium]RQV92366.1 MAG: 50S ribosomal protein L30 [bacterium]RQV98710.1 MAG: 50S ribosomal protein L30 [Calditrichota bacterium]
MAQKKEKKLKITQVRSTISEKPSHKKTLKALGLRKIGHTREYTDTPQIRGMISKIRHMVTWEEV